MTELTLRKCPYCGLELRHGDRHGVMERAKLQEEITFKTLCTINREFKLNAFEEVKVKETK